MLQSLEESSCDRSLNCSIAFEEKRLNHVEQRIGVTVLALAETLNKEVPRHSQQPKQGQ